MAKIDEEALAEAYNRALAHEKAGEIDAAVAAYGEVLEIDPDDHGGAAVRIASLGRGETPPRAPDAYVETLFDDYADSFAQHLVGSLRYQGPERLVALLREQGATRFDAALDLGCGTGLCGALLRPLCGQLAGVDLSQRMVEQARASGHYDSLCHADVVEALDGAPQRAGIPHGAQPAQPFAHDLPLFTDPSLS